MAYDVDFWYVSQDACQITTDFTPFSEHEEESIYMKTSDFSEMIERFTDPDLERKAKAWDKLKEDVKKWYEREMKEPSNLVGQQYVRGFLVLMDMTNDEEDGLDLIQNLSSDLEDE
jgi:hypothetical protein